MSSKENNITPTQLEDEFDKVRRSVYLEAPELWIELSDKISDGIFDEMLLFFATKYNSLPILRYASKNNLVDLDAPSKNKAYSSIRHHLSSVSRQNKFDEIYNFLNNNDITLTDDQVSVDDNTVSNTKVKIEDVYIPEFICNKCNSNIFECGYSVCQNTIYKYSKDENKIVQASDDVSNSIICCNCNHTIEDVSVSKLEQLCEIQNCNKCGLDLTITGIVDKIKMIYDADTKQFTSKSTSYHCDNCDMIINEQQKEYFGL